MHGEHASKAMRIEVAGAEDRGGLTPKGTSAFMLVERASLYMLAGSDGNAPDAARTVLATLHHGFADVHVAPHVEDDEAVTSALLSLYAGMLASNVLVRDKRGAGEDVGVSFVGVSVRGGSLCIAQAGGARVSRVGRKGVERLTDTSRPEREAPALGLLPKSATEPFVGTWGPGDVLVLARQELADGRLIARTVLETTSLGDAARELAGRCGVVVLIRWIR